jgi:hypothetical protein
MLRVFNRVAWLSRYAKVRLDLRVTLARIGLAPQSGVSSPLAARTKEYGRDFVGSVGGA